MPWPSSLSVADLSSSALLRTIKDGTVDLVINVASPARSSQPERNFHIRRTAVDFGVPLLTNIKLVTMFADAIEKHKRVRTREVHVCHRCYDHSSCWPMLAVPSGRS